MTNNTTTQQAQKKTLLTRKEISEKNKAGQLSAEDSSETVIGQTQSNSKNELVLHSEATIIDTKQTQIETKKKVKRPINMTAYDILNIRRAAPQTDVFAAFRKLALQWHPDRHPVTSRAQATQCFNIVNEAYESLKTRERRAAYDKSLLREAAFNAQYMKNKRFRRANDNKNNKHLTRIALALLGTMFWPFEKQTHTSINQTNSFTNIDL